MQLGGLARRGDCSGGFWMAGTRDTLGSLSYCPACARAQDLGAGNFGGKGGDALREAPPTPPHRPPPSATRRLGSPECPRCPGLAPPCAGVYSWSRGFGGPAAGTRIRGALWTPRARGPRLHSGLGQGAPVCALLAATLGPGPGVWKPRCEPRACAHPRAGGGDACPHQFGRPRQGESQLLALGALLWTRLDLGPSPHFSGELVMAIVGGWSSLPTRVLSIVCHVFILAWEGRPER